MFVANYSIDIPAEKLRNYLLNQEHPDGKSKAKYFHLQGFTNPTDLERALRNILQLNPISQEVSSVFGIKYIVDGSLSTNPAARVRTVWIVLHGENICRFVTAYPI